MSVAVFRVRDYEENEYRAKEGQYQQTSSGAEGEKLRDSGVKGSDTVWGKSSAMALE